MNLLQIMKTSKDCPTIEFSSPSDKEIKMKKNSRNKTKTINITDCTSPKATNITI